MREYHILVCQWDIYPYRKIIKAFQRQGHHIDVLVLPVKNSAVDPGFTQVLYQRLTACHYDALFSVNYYISIAQACDMASVLYLSWTCDTPLLQLHHPSVYLPTNRIFTFDYQEFQTLQALNVSHSFYLPLAGEAPEAIAPLEEELPSVAFVGSLYDKSRYHELEGKLPDYLCGYLDAALEAQSHIGCGNLLSSMLTDAVLEQLAPYLHLEDWAQENEGQDGPQGRCRRDLRQEILQRGLCSPEDLEILTGRDTMLKLHFATSVLSYEVAARSRRNTLTELARLFPVDLYTPGHPVLPGVNVHPPVDYHTEMDRIFASSKINLNMTIPNIESGIPLRVWDVLAAGGFLLTDYRAEYASLLENGKDLVIYDGLEDLAVKAAYYLEHPEERKKIAGHGQRTVLQKHSYGCRIRQMLEEAFS